MSGSAPSANDPVVLPSGRRQTPSARQLLAIKNLSENGGNKGKALLDAGYSKSVAETPSRVFGSPTVRSLLDEIGFTEALVKAHLDLFNAYEPAQMTFPSAFADDDIREFLEGVECRVASIVHRKNVRIAHFFVRDYRALAQALDMGYKVHGAYVPLRTMKGTRSEDVWSLSELRRRMEEKGTSVI